MFKLKLRSKLIIYSIALAIIPLGIAGKTMISITQDELKSSVNDQISNTIAQISDDIDKLYADTWLAPLMLIASGIENEKLGVDAKISLIKAGIENIADVAACQISVIGMAEPIIITKDDFTEHLTKSGLEPAEILRFDPETLLKSAADDNPPDELQYIPASDDWLLSIIIPIRNLAAGQKAFFISTINLKRLRSLISSHPFNRTGKITIADADGRQLFDPQRKELNDLEIVQKALKLMNSPYHSIGVTPYTRPDGELNLAGFSFPKHFKMAVIVEQSERTAYAAIDKMIHTLTKLIIAVLTATIIGAILFAMRISRPMEEIADVAQKVGSGNLDVQVSAIKSKDEIGILATRMNAMIVGLRDRDRIRNTFGRYMSDDVVKAILESPEGSQIGGAKREVTIIMTDLRGFTSMGERLSPEDVVTILNIYLETMTDIILKYKGTIIAFIGDAILIIFGAPIAREDDVQRAIACAVEMQQAMQTVNTRCIDLGYPEIHQGIGINTGKVVVGNIGSEKRMKYDCIGRNVNLASRIESYTVGGQILISESTKAACPETLRIDGQTEVFPKGFREPIMIYDVSGIGGPNQNGLNVYLKPKKAVKLIKIEHPVKTEFTALKGKEAGADIYSGTIVRLSEQEAQMRSIIQVNILENLKITLFDKNNNIITTELFAKVTDIPDKKAPSHQNGTDKDSESKMSVLLVDDQPLIGMTMRRMFDKEEDISFHYCDDPTQAIQMANEIHPTVILQDMVMPQMDGWELLKKFRTNPVTRNTPLIVLSATDKPLIKAKAFSHGAADYMVKLPHQLEVVARIRYHAKSYIDMPEQNETEFIIHFTSVPPEADKFLRNTL
ncbi:adenylate/guanylate cyclase domain-containing protein [Desulfococcaceae bacterium HSG9]|nr:adenylate/guanylate cyclase domain-containing protein [Desulfococcaceae bacterium HSG9]